MSSGGGQILVTFATIAEASQNVNRTYSNLTQKLDDLRQMLQPITNDWTGDAAQQYQQKQQQWNQAQQDLGQVLQTISQVLDSTHDAYNQTESANRNAWS